MDISRDLETRLRQVMTCPTAPFHEGRVHAVLRRAVRESPRLRDRVDKSGNLEIVYGRGRPRLLFACHTDHPALEANGDGTAAIRGGIRPQELEGARVVTFDGDRTCSVGALVEPGVVRLQGDGRLPRGTPLVLDLPALRLSGGLIRARAVDDLCAVAVCLAAADRLAAARWGGTVGFLFTRAEEVGLAGALAWVKDTRYPRSTTLVNIEMSPALPHTPQGAGPVLRTGDRISTFDPEVSMALEETARALAAREPGFSYQRALMDGGGCEATVYLRAGFRAGALCLPMRNPHNHAERGGMGLERVRQRDAENLLRWVVAFARDFGRLEPYATLDRRLDRTWRKHRRALGRSADQGRGG